MVVVVVVVVVVVAQVVVPPCAYFEGYEVELARDVLRRFHLSLLFRSWQYLVRAVEAREGPSYGHSRATSVWL